MKRYQTPSQRFFSQKYIGIGILMLGGLSLIGFVLQAIVRIRTGQGLEYYISTRGIETNSLLALMTFALSLPCILVGIWFSWKRSHKDKQDSQRNSHNNPITPPMHHRKSKNKE